MKAWKLRAGRDSGRAVDQRRAVIDIGSNTVRLVIYGAPPRSPVVLWNEKVSARLGRDLATTGMIPQAAMNEALAALARYRLIIQDLGIENVEAVATAAPREAKNGSAFLSRVAALGLDVRLLSGEDEACASAYGAIGAFRSAAGIVSDLGGGSLELVPIAGGECGSGCSLPLGTLLLPSLREKRGFSGRVAKMLAPLDASIAEGKPLYMIGGTWRAFATYAMRVVDHPLTDPHGFRMSLDEADELAKVLQHTQPAQIAQIKGVSAMRAGKLPDAAALLRALLAHLQPEALIFSSWGLREGLHFRRLDEATRRSDPLLAGIIGFTGMSQPGMANAELLSEWASAVAGSGDAVGARIRLAGAHLALALHRVEPNLRPAQALEWALDKRWIGIGPEERATLAAILASSLGQTNLPDRVSRLAPPALLDQALGSGLALRLAQRLGAGSSAALEASELRIENETLTLRIAKGYADLAAPLVKKDLGTLAAALGLRAELKVERPSA